MKSFFFALILGFLLTMLGIVGTMDYNSAQIDEEEYCSNVADGTWPDYKKIYESACKSVEAR